MKSQQPRYYRPELDVVRLFAFSSVFFHHLGTRLPGSVPTWVLSTENAMGFGLCLFFALSAYLITTLLLKEVDLTGTVSLSRFYERRALRIWPLYLGAILLGVVISTVNGRFHSEWVWFVAALFMAGNLVARPATIVAHMWSISVEEQFYVVWPGLMKRVGKRGLFFAASVMVVLANLALIHFGLMHTDVDSEVWSNTLVQSEMFATGIVLALLKPRNLQSSGSRFLCIAALPVAWLAASHFCQIKSVGTGAIGPVSLCMGYGLVAASCGLFIYGMLGLKRWPRWMIYLGKISYGLYVFHALALKLVHRLDPVVKAPLAMAITICLAALSYKYFETPFLKLKERLEVVPARPILAT